MGPVLSSVLFGLAHLTHGDWLAVVGITINAGFTMGLLYMATGSIWMSIGLHTAWDFTEVSLLGVNSHNGLLLSTPVAGKPELLTGGQFGRMRLSFPCLSEFSWWRPFVGLENGGSFERHNRSAPRSQLERIISKMKKIIPASFFGMILGLVGLEMSGASARRCGACPMCGRDDNGRRRFHLDPVGRVLRCKMDHGSGRGPR
jgi:hypothetical protein